MKENNRIHWPMFIISGKKQSGKDEVCKMLQYIIKPLVELSYMNFIINIFYVYYLYSKNENESYVPKDIFTKNKYRNLFEYLPFAKNLKNILSTILCVPVDYFNDNKYKSNYYVNIKTFEKFDLVNNPNQNFQKTDDIKTLREIMQEVGNYIEPYFGEDIWVKSTLNTAKEIIDSNKEFLNKTTNWYIPIISDLRRQIELESIRTLFDKKDYVTIRIVRYMTSDEWYKETGLKKSGFIINDADGWDRENFENSFYREKITINEFLKRLFHSTCISNSESDSIIKSLTHETETELDNYNNFDYVIDNDSDLTELFVKVYKIVNKIAIDEFINKDK